MIQKSETDERTISEKQTMCEISLIGMVSKSVREVAYALHMFTIF